VNEVSRIISPDEALARNVARHDAAQRQLLDGLLCLINGRLGAEGILGGGRRSPSVVLCVVEIPNEYHGLPDPWVREVLAECNAAGWQVTREGAWRWSFRPRPSGAAGDIAAG
jgi:hypothetical protein